MSEVCRTQRVLHFFPRIAVTWIRRLCDFQFPTMKYRPSLPVLLRAESEENATEGPSKIVLRAVPMQFPSVSNMFVPPRESFFGEYDVTR